MGLFDFFGSDDDQNQSRQGWMANLTGIPDEEGQAQLSALGAALMQGGAAIARANRPSFYGAPRTGELFAQGMGGFSEGLGVQAMMRQKAAVDAAKQKMAEAAAQREDERWKREQGEAARGEEYINSLPPEQRAAAWAMGAGNYAKHNMSVQDQMMQAGYQRNQQTGEWEIAPWRLDALRKEKMIQLMGQKQDSPWIVDAPNNRMINKTTGEARPLMMRDAEGGMSPVAAGEKGEWVVDAKNNRLINKQSGETKPLTTRDEQGNVVAVGQQGDEPSPYQVSVLEDIGKAKSLANDYTFIPNTGGGSYGWKSIPGTSAHDLSMTINAIKSSVGFDRLQYMREHSPTGGALGSVSNDENKLLQSALGALEQSMSKKEFMSNLERVETHYLDIVHGKGNWARDKSGDVIVGKGVGKQKATQSQQKKDYSAMTDEELMRELQ